MSISKTLDVPGAVLSYAVAGSGPLLLLVHGMPSDSYDFVELVPLLVDRFTVVTYDLRGFGASRLVDADADNSPSAHGADAHLLLRALGDEPAHVFASSAGGLGALWLAARHPEQIRTLIVHEPPVLDLLPDDDPRRRIPTEVIATYREHGLAAAMQQFAVRLGLAGGPPGPVPEPSPELTALMARMGEKMARMQRGAEFFLTRVLPLGVAVPGPAELPAVTVAIGADSDGQACNDAARALAAGHGTEPVVLPGGHVGVLTHPAPFAAALRTLLPD